MKIVHQQWQLVGSVLVVDDEGEALVIGKDAQGNTAKVGQIVITVDRFRGSEFEASYQKARAACEELLVKFGEQPPVIQRNIELLKPVADHPAE